MTKLEQLYNAIQNLKELGVQLPDKLIEETDQIEEEIIKNEVIPALSAAIAPIINQIQRELILVVEYKSGEPLQVKMTRKRSFKFREKEDNALVVKDAKNEDVSNEDTRHTRGSRTNLSVLFPDGKKISNKFAYQTFCELIKIIGPEKVTSLGITQSGKNIVTRETDYPYDFHSIGGGWYVITHSSTKVKKKYIEEISDRLNLDLKVEE